MAKAAAADACATESGMSLGSAKGPQTRTPSRPVSSGLNSSSWQKPWRLRAMPSSPATSCALRAGSRPDARDDHVVLGGHEVAGLVLERDVEVLAQRVLFDRRRARANVLHAAVEGALVEGVEALAHGAHVHEQDLALGPGKVILREHGLLGRVHAADAGAVVVLLVARADALDEGDALRVGFVGRAQHVADGRTRGGEHALVLERREHVRVAAVAVLAVAGRGRRRRSRSP